MKGSARTGVFIAAAALMLAGSPAWSKSENQLKYFLINSGLQPEAEGKVLFVSNPAQSFFSIAVSDMTPGTYDVVLNGGVVDTLTVNADGEGSVSHKAFKNHKHKSATLPYDPRGGDLAIMATGVELLGANIPLTAAEAREKQRVEIQLANMGVGAGSALAELTSRFGRIQFEVELSGAAPGTYDLLVGGVKVGEIVVDADGTGDIEFDSRPSSDDDDDGLATLLTFDPRGQQLELAQIGVAMFGVMFPLE